MSVSRFPFWWVLISFLIGSALKFWYNSFGIFERRGGGRRRAEGCRGGGEGRREKNVPGGRSRKCYESAHHLFMRDFCVWNTRHGRGGGGDKMVSDRPDWHEVTCLQQDDLQATRGTWSRVGQLGQRPSARKKRKQHPVKGTGSNKLPTLKAPLSGNSGLFSLSQENLWDLGSKSPNYKEWLPSGTTASFLLKNYGLSFAFLPKKKNQPY